MVNESSDGTPQQKAATKKGTRKTATHPSIQKGGLWIDRLERRLREILAEVKDIFRSLGSPDRPTRRMSGVFFLSTLGVVVVFCLTIKHMIDVRRAKGLNANGTEDQATRIGEFLRKQADEAKHKFSMLTIGTFTVELRAIAGQKSVAGVMNLAEVEIVLECDSKDTRNYIEENLAQTRNQITNVFTAIDRDELLTREGKRRIKKMIADRINIWLPKGKVEELYFSKLVLS